VAEKQFPPSPRRLAKLRKDGKIVKSQWVAIALSYWAMVLCAPLTLSWVRGKTLIHWLNYEVWTPSAALQAALGVGFRAVALLLSAVVCSALLTEVAQSRGLLLPSLLSKGFHRYRPGAYLSRVSQACADVCMGLVRCAVLVVVMAPVFSAFITHSRLLVVLRGEQVVAVLSAFVYSVVLRGGAVLSLIACIAYGLARWRFFRQNRMTLQDLREEHKEGEGDPHLKSARKHEHMVLVMSELERRVKRSRVIVVRRTKRSPAAMQ